MRGEGRAVAFALPKGYGNTVPIRSRFDLDNFQVDSAGNKYDDSLGFTETYLRESLGEDFDWNEWRKQQGYVSAEDVRSEPDDLDQHRGFLKGIMEREGPVGKGIKYGTIVLGGALAAGLAAPQDANAEDGLVSLRWDRIPDHPWHVGYVIDAWVEGYYPETSVQFYVWSPDQTWLNLILAIDQYSSYRFKAATLYTPDNGQTYKIAGWGDSEPIGVPRIIGNKGDNNTVDWYDYYYGVRPCLEVMEGDPDWLDFEGCFKYDFDDNGIVNNDDARHWRSNYGKTQYNPLGDTFAINDNTDREHPSNLE